MFPDAICEPTGAAQHLSCPSCLDFEICRPTHDFSTTYAALVDMFSNDYTMIDGNSNTLMRGTCNSVKRSVPNMTSLLPLKLLSPTLPQSDLWPSASQDQRSTFGAIPSSQESSRVQGKTNNPLGLRLSLLPPRSSQRDTPIYTEPGSPLPGRAYYTSEDICFNSSQTCNEGSAFHGLGHAEFRKLEDEVDDEVVTQSNALDAIDFRRRSYVSQPRSSGLSFQCSGEELFPSEAAWLNSPLPILPNSQNVRRRSALRGPLERNVESWLSDTASEMDEDVLVCATAVSPTKAQMVNVNTSRFSDKNRPPRVSSLESPSSSTLVVGGRYSWASSEDSPPNTPTGEREFDDNRSPCREPQWIFPNRRFDLAMNSPPMSPKVFPDPPAASRFSFSVISAGIEIGKDPNMASRWSFDSTASEQKSNVDITDLENIVSGFPSNMLLPDTPCISEIRLSLSNVSPQHKYHATSDSLPADDRKSVANFSRPRRTNCLSSSQSTPMVQTTAWQSSHISKSTIQPNLTLPAPDLNPLSRMFPNSSEYTRLALYAHAIAYIFITSLPTKSTQIDSPSRYRRDTSYWTTSPLPSQAAAVLGYPRTSHSYTYSSESGLQTRILHLKSSLRKCIFRLMKNMDSSISQADDDLESGKGDLTLRALEEVVRGSEKLAFVGF
ncbi:hypothetical protein BKA65DRAFT_38849 [Rhexocercosporidium sp. MPI-PUGE-AT-0058]|nr:hypothetical protein BKA65DRAFT_38849 [Rhexocercosporidium sp. MPI-PUGE-AT-0058]